jgi:sulfur carrier protein ThiS
MSATGHTAIGHNVAGAEVEFEVRLFNSISRIAGGGYGGIAMRLRAGSTIDDLLEALAVPAREVFLVLVNGKDITPSLYGGIRTDYAIQDGDRVALSGPVPYGWGYGSPVV